MKTTVIAFKGGELADVTYALEKRIEELADEAKVSNDRKESLDYMGAAERLRKLVCGIEAQKGLQCRKSGLKTCSGAGRKTSMGDFLMWAMGRYDLWHMASLARNDGDDGWLFQWRELPGGVSDAEILKTIPARKFKT